LKSRKEKQLISLQYEMHKHRTSSMKNFDDIRKFIRGIKQFTHFPTGGVHGLSCHLYE